MLLLMQYNKLDSSSHLTNTDTVKDKDKSLPYFNLADTINASRPISKSKSDIHGFVIKNESTTEMQRISKSTSPSNKNRGYHSLTTNLAFIPTMTFSSTTCH